MADSPPDDKDKSLEYSLKDGSAFSVMTGFGEQYLNPLAIELGASNIQIGLLASVPPFIASLAQLYTTRLVSIIRGRRQVITKSVLLQALMWIPLVLIPIILVPHKVSLLIFFVVLYFVFGQFVAPVWNSLMGDLVDEDVRGRFFGMRNKITGAVAFFSLFAAGFILSMFPKDRIMYGFALIFSVAFAARIVSWHYLGRMRNPPVTSAREAEFSFIQYLKKLRETNYGRFALYYGLMNFTVNIASPFFTVYLLRDLHLPYYEYTIITASVALASFLTMTYWGRLADRYGNAKILTFCGALVPVVPILWLFSKDVTYLVLIQAVSGFAWAGFNLSASNYMFDTVKPLKRTRVFSYHNVLAGSSIFLGAMLGGLMSKVITSPWIFYSNLQILFLISGLLRAGVSLIFLPKIREVREVEQITTKDFFIKYSGTGPILGLTYRAVTGLHRSFTRDGGARARGRAA
ncbi:MAG: MFS transporter [Candidatus Altiarchaeota archaeon]